MSAWALLTGIASRPAEPASSDASRRSRLSSRRPVRPYCSTGLRTTSDAPGTLGYRTERTAAGRTDSDTLLPESCV